MHLATIFNKNIGYNQLIFCKRKCYCIMCVISLFFCIFQVGFDSNDNCYKLLKIYDIFNFISI